MDLQIRGFSLWQARFYERALRKVKEYHETPSYIYLNPVKRNLVSAADE